MIPVVTVVAGTIIRSTIIRMVVPAITGAIIGKRIRDHLHKKELEEAQSRRGRP